MKTPKDRFSKQSESYYTFRPSYPEALFSYVYSFCRHFDTAWDCGTGNGQVAGVLATEFRKVHATDISERQIQQAPPHDRIEYSLQRAEKTRFPDSYFDLITVAQAIHWFDHNAFNKEVERVLKPDGVLAIWGYGLLQTEPQIQKYIESFYAHTLSTYWDIERRHIDDHYSRIPFPFPEVSAPPVFEIRTSWSLSQLEGYFNSWSAVQNYKALNPETDPVKTLIQQIDPVWKTTYQNIRFPVFLKLGVRPVPGNGH